MDIRNSVLERCFKRIIRLLIEEIIPTGIKSPYYINRPVETTYISPGANLWRKALFNLLRTIAILSKSPTS